MGFIYTRSTLPLPTAFLLLLLSRIPLVKSDFPYKLTNKNTHKKGANITETFAGHSTPLVCICMTDSYIYIYKCLSAYVYIMVHICVPFYLCDASAKDSEGNVEFLMQI